MGDVKGLLVERVGRWFKGDMVKGVIREFVEMERVCEGGWGGKREGGDVVDVGRDMDSYVGEVKGCGGGKREE